VTLRAYVKAEDPVSRAGVASQLLIQPDVRVLDEEHLADADLAIVVVDRFTEAVAAGVRRLRQRGPERVVLVASQLDDGALLLAIESGVAGIVHRTDATPDALMAAAATVAAGDGALPSDLVGRLLTSVSRLQHGALSPRGLNHAALTEREIDVLRLVAEGCDTGEIATQLSYSERTIKGILHDVTSRLGLRNRAHAVAYAIREGVL
jgi:DNA-binding NarL/FixJ family response regulator